MIARRMWCHTYKGGGDRTQWSRKGGGFRTSDNTTGITLGISLCWLATIKSWSGSLSIYEAASGGQRSTRFSVAQMIWVTTVNTANILSWTICMYWLLSIHGWLSDPALKNPIFWPLVKKKWPRDVWTCAISHFATPMQLQRPMTFSNLWVFRESSH